MSMKTILVPAEPRTSMSGVLQTALLIARRFDSYIEGFALRSRISEFVAVDMGGHCPTDALNREGVEEAKKTKAMFESFMQENGVPRSGQAASGVSFGWLDDAPEGEGAVGSYGRVFDLIVLSRPDANSMGMQNRALESG